MPIHLANIWGFNSSQIGLAYLAQVIPASLAQPIAGYLFDRIGAKILCGVAIILNSVAMSLMGLPSAQTVGGPISLIALAGMNEFFTCAYYAAILSEASHAAKSLANGSNTGVSQCYGFANTAYALGKFYTTTSGK